jgi:peptidyl-tRNA hydrolase
MLVYGNTINTYKFYHLIVLLLLTVKLGRIGYESDCRSGNPGIKYVNNRHNVGHMVIDELQNLKLKDKILKSDKYMNDSGLFIKKLKEKYPKMQLTDLYIIHDDLDIAFKDDEGDW